MTWIIILIIVLAVVLCFCLAIANFATDRFWDLYQELDKLQAKNGLTTKVFIHEVNKERFDNKLNVVQNRQQGGDAYARGGNLFLSLQTMMSGGLASYAIMAHELGHAMQDKEGKKLKTMSLLRRLGSIVGLFMLPSLIIGAILALIGGKVGLAGYILLGIGGLIFLFSIILKSITISIEKDASKKALVLLDGYLDKNELKVCKKFLNSAKLTYWADLIRALLSWTALTKKSKYFN